MSPSPGEDTAAVGQFFNEQWTAYEKMLHHDLLGHRGLFDAARGVLARHFARSYALLDLGCGDARFSRRAVEGTSIARYVGIDLSEVALAGARKNMADLAIETAFELGNAFEPAAVAGTFDAVLASFSMHHLSEAQKGDFLTALRPRLSADGVYLMIDLTRRDDETCESGVSRLTDHARRHWDVPHPGREWFKLKCHSSAHWSYWPVQRCCRRYGRTASPAGGWPAAGTFRIFGCSSRAPP